MRALAGVRASAAVQATAGRAAAVAWAARACDPDTAIATSSMTSSLPCIHAPSRAGGDALAELDRVAWSELSHCYGMGRVGDALHQDLHATLARLGDGDPDAIEDALQAMWSNVCHQGTIYEATAHAVPFLAAFAAGPGLWIGNAAELAVLLGEIAVASSFTTENGTSAGAYGEGVGEATRAAFVASRAWLTAMAATHPATAELATAIEELTAADPPTRAMVDRVAEAVEALEDEDFGERPRADPAVLDGPRVRHATFGAGQVVAREPGKVRVRFDDGMERTLLERFVVPETDA